MLVVVRTFELNLGEYREVVGRVTTVALLIDGDVLLNLDAGGHENKVDAGIRCDCAKPVPGRVWSNRLFCRQCS